MATGGLLVLCAALAPFARIPLAGWLQFLTISESALVVVNLMAAMLLLGHVRASRKRPLAILALAYLFSSVIAAVHLFCTTQSDAQARAHMDAWLYLTWHAIFPLLVIDYAHSRDVRLPGHFMRTGALLTVLFVALLALLIRHGASVLPPLVDGIRHLPTYSAVATGAALLSLAAIVSVLRKRPRGVLDLWVLVALVACMCQLLLSGLFSGTRYDLGIYAGYIFCLAGSLYLLGALAVDNISLHTRFAATIEEMARARAREQWESLLGSVLRQLPDSVLLVDADGTCLMANEQANRTARLFDSHEPDGPDGAESLLALLREPVRRAAAGESFKGGLLETSVNGSQHSFSVSGAPLRDGAAELAAAVVVLDDVTERTQASAALGRALDQTRYLIENTPLAVIEWDRDFVITLWNRRAEELFGWRADEVIGQRVDSYPIIHEDDRGRVAEVMGRMADPATHYLTSYNRNRTRDGRTIHAEWYNSVLHDEHGDIVTGFSLVQDVTERESAMQQLREADRRKDDYIATLAHELRNPLAPIMSAATLLRSRELSPERIEWIAGMLGRQASQMARLLDDLLDVSRIGRGKIELRRVTVELAPLLRDALQTSAPLIDGGRHEVVLALPDDPLWVDADPARLIQVLSNLINNAAKYTPAHGRIEIALSRVGNEAVISVRDNGIGIEAEMLERVFDPFVQAGGARQLAQGGLGIGLALVKGLVELHGGTITAASRGAGRGAAFTVTLPLALPAACAQAKHDAPVPTALRKTVLIADDNTDAADSLALLLSSEGASVEVARDGMQALRMFRKRPADIVVLDLGMPEMNGLEVARQLSEATPRPYLIALTGRGRKEDRAASLDAGFDAHLTKPIAPQELLELLRGL